MSLKKFMFYAVPCKKLRTGHLRPVPGLGQGGHLVVVEVVQLVSDELLLVFGLGVRRSDACKNKQNQKIS